MTCHICNHKTEVLFNAPVLGKYHVDYFQCSNCRFIQTEFPYWLKESYDSPIALLDVGMLMRNINLKKRVEPILFKNFNYGSRFLDYGGGYGIFVRLMRDSGFDFYRQDIYCENLFAKYFDVVDLPSGTKFEAVTAFELLEHLIDPLDTINTIFKYSDTLIFSTELQPPDTRFINDWWYFVPETGQHVSFYTLKSLNLIAEKLNGHLYSNNYDLHIITLKRLKNNPFNENNLSRRIRRKLSEIICNRWLNKTVHLETLLEKDFKFYKSLADQSKKI
jgi:hypothetical protein